MINIILLSSIILFILYTLYAQFGINKRKGETLLKVKIKKQTKIDAIIFIGLIIILISQAEGTIPAFTLYLLSFCIVFGLYAIFFQHPLIFFKQEGFFFDNIFIDYQKIKQLNISADHFLVIDLTNKKRLTAKLINPDDEKRILNLFNSPTQQ